jgi:ferredoxin-NADP reductase
VLEGQLGSEVFRYAGFLLLTLLVAQSAVALLARIRRYGDERRAEREERELFRERVLLVRTRRVESSRPVDAWNGWRKFEIARKTPECDGVTSFELVPHDGKSIPAFRPGQFLTLQVRPTGQPKPLVRCYSLSDAPAPDHYRITVKRIGPPSRRSDAQPGLVSSFLCDETEEGSIVDVKAPAGRFYLDSTRRSPLVLVAGGVGITPFLSMLATLEQRGFDREVQLFYGVKDPGSEVRAAWLERLAAQHPEHFQLHVCYSRVERDALPARPAPVHCSAGRVGGSLFRERLPSTNYDFLLCGPPALLGQVTADLRTWGVANERIAYEAFGPDSVKQANAEPAAAPDAAPAVGPSVTFARSSRQCRWDGSVRSLLELAEREGVAIDSNCRAGNCGTCWVAIRSGEIAYVHKPGEEPESGSCLTCVAVPKSDVVLDV